MIINGASNLASNNKKNEINEYRLTKEGMQDSAIAYVREYGVFKNDAGRKFRNIELFIQGKTECMYYTGSTVLGGHQSFNLSIDLGWILKSDYHPNNYNIEDCYLCTVMAHDSTLGFTSQYDIKKTEQYIEFFQITSDLKASQLFIYYDTHLLLKCEMVE